MKKKVHISSNPDTMRLELNERHMGVGGFLAKAVKGAQKNVLPAAEREANLAKMLEQSAVKQRMYHGSSNPTITQFKTGKMKKDEEWPSGHSTEPWAVDNRDAVFLSPNPVFSNNYAGGSWEVEIGKSPTSYPVYVQAKKPWDYENPQHVENVIKLYKERFPLARDSSGGVPSDESMRHISFEKKLRSLKDRENNWSAIENAELQDLIKDLGHDSFYVKEAGVKNLGVYDPNAIKSAIGNRGTYDVTDPDINKAAGGEVHMQDGGAAFGVFPQMKPRRGGRSDVDPNVVIPRGLARGFVAGAAGAPGDTELIARLLANTPGVQAYGEATGAATPGKYRKGEVGLETRLPTSEEIEERLPFRGTSPMERAATGAGMIGGGFYTGPGAPIRAATAIPTAVVKAARDFGQAAGQTVSPLIVYHGSPHRFPPTKKNPLGEFDRTKIGTGEGAQAFGYGHYVAEAPGVGESYRMTTTGKLHELENILATKKWQKDILDDVSTFMSRENVVDPVVAIDGYAKQLESLASSFPDSASRLLAKRDWLLSQKDVAKAKRAGHLYTVDLPDEKIAQMLDWDKPLSEQGRIMDVLKPRVEKNPEAWGQEQWLLNIDLPGRPGKSIDALRTKREAKEYLEMITGERLYQSLDPTMGPRNSAEALRAAGIPGIRYLDRGSRGAGQGTSNFVVFPGEEEILTILERKKGGGAVGMAGGGAISADDLIIEERPL